MTERFPNLPTLKDPEQVVRSLNDMCERVKGINKLVDAVERSPKFDPHAVIVHKIAMHMEPRDPEWGFDPEKPFMHAFYKGALLGLLAAAKMLNDLDFTMLAEALQATAEEVDARAAGAESLAEREGMFITEILEIAENPAILRPFEILIYAWEDHLSPDNTATEFVTSGFGFVMATAIEMKRQFDTIRIEQDLQDFNSIIETELDKLLGYI